MVNLHSCYEACTVWVGAITGGGVAVWGTGGAWHPRTHLCAHPPFPPPPPLLSPSCPYDTHLRFHLLAHWHRQLPAPPLSAPPGWLWPARPGPGRSPRAYRAPWRWSSWLCYVFNTAGDFVANVSFFFFSFFLIGGMYTCSLCLLQILVLWFLLVKRFKWMFLRLLVIYCLCIGTQLVLLSIFSLGFDWSISFNVWFTCRAKWIKIKRTVPFSDWHGKRQDQCIFFLIRVHLFSSLTGRVQ